VHYTDDALVAAVEYSSRYITGRFLPDKAIDVIDEAGARVRLRAMTQPPDLKEIDQEIARSTRRKKSPSPIRTSSARRSCATSLQAPQEERAAHDRVEGRKPQADRRHVVDVEVIAETVSKMTGIPLHALGEGRSRAPPQDGGRTAQVGHFAGRSDHRDREGRASFALGLKDPRRPMGSFIFLGPTGVGKTHLAKQLAKFMFGSKTR
jgi:ATP-dependent Clp protease ATP-binding subunit ClpC